MIAAVLLAAYAAAVGLLAPAALRRRWAARSPRLVMSLWLLLPVSWTVAVALALLAATAPSRLTWLGPQPGAGHALLAGPAPGGTAAAVAGLLLAAAVVLRTGWCLARELARGRRDRHEHAARVAAAGHPCPELGVVVLDHDTPAAYCMPSGRYRLVVSAGALATLGTDQLQAVLAHERAHLRYRHHLMLAVAAALARAFPRVPLLAQAGPELGVLAEMAADDAAARRHGPDHLAEALVILARAAAARPAALSAGGPAAVARVQRLLAPPEHRQARCARLAATAGLLLPAAIACLPLIIAACEATARP